MNNSRKKIWLFAGVAAIVFLYSFTFSDIPKTKEITYNPDSISSPEYIKRLVTYAKKYDFIKYSQNYIEWQDYSSIKPFFDKLKQTPTRKLKVVHIGDSHLQADVYTGYVRNELQVIFGEGGRGFTFPYAAASTHSAYDYLTSCKGKWDFSNNVQPYPVYDLGITGATVHTEDSTASFKFVFSKGTLKKNFNILKLYCKRSPESFDLKLKTSANETPLYIDCNSYNDKLYIEINLAKACDTLEFFVNKTDTAQKYFECYGMLIETNEDHGILYNSVGINGAGLYSVLKEELLLYQLQELKPDLVVIDLGGNDFYKVKFLSDVIESNLCKIIDIVQRAAPDASIILSDLQDVYYKYWNEGNCKLYSALMREVAAKKGCAFYDYYYVAGGQYSMLKWLSNKLAQWDKVHLTFAGYYLKGELFCNALLNSYYLSLTRDSLDSFTALKEFPDTTKSEIILAAKTLPEVKDTSVTTQIVQQQEKVWTTQTYYYTIKSGDVLGTIAKKYGVTVKQLQSWNSLKSTNIIAGKTLIIYKQVLTTKSDTSTNSTTTTTTTTTTTKPTTTTTTTATGTKYTVVSGDNLWTIAKKYGTTVDKIKKLNNRTDDKLKPGMVLKIK